MSNVIEMFNLTEIDRLSRVTENNKIRGGIKSHIDKMADDLMAEKQWISPKFARAWARQNMPRIQRSYFKKVQENK